MAPIYRGSNNRLRPRGVDAEALRSLNTPGVLPLFRVQSEGRKTAGSLMSKRVYKFMSAQHGLSNLENRRLKVSTIDDLNDPFDLASIDFTDPIIENAIAATIIGWRGKNGLLCFSRNWDNLLLWTHYGASHTGLCLGFDIPDAPGQRIRQGRSLPAQCSPNQRPSGCEPRPCNEVAPHQARELELRAGGALICQAERYT
jgi:hypothetical protein